MRRKTLKEFMQQIYELVGNEYTVLGQYVNTHTKILIRHNKCSHEFKMEPNSFLSANQRCPKCLGGSRKTHEEFVSEICSLVQDEYSVVGQYLNADTKIKMKHNKCGFEFEMRPSCFVNRQQRCPYCSEKSRRKLKTKTHENFTKRVYEKYGTEYIVLGKYVNCNTKILIKHNKNECKNEWSVTPMNFLRGRECPVCNESHGEKHIRQYLKNKNFQYKREYRFEDCKDKRPLPFDFAIVSENRVVVLIEYDGIQHFESINYYGGKKGFEKIQHHDHIKTLYCTSNNIPLVRIPYTEKDIEKYLDYKLDQIITPTA